MKFPRSIFSTLVAALVLGFWLNAQPAQALFSGNVESDGLMPCSGKCEASCTGAKANMPIEGCPNKGEYCCVQKQIQQTTPACLGLCLPVEQCDPTTITAQPSTPNKACGEGTSDGYACCGAQKKETLSPTGLPCCVPTDQCKTKINPGVVCPQKGYGCCISAEANGGSTKSTIDDKCGNGGFPCPLGTDIPALLGNVIGWVLGLVGALFLAMFVWGGALYITAGDSKRAEEGQKTLVNAVIGVVIVMLSYTMVNWVLSKISGI